MNSFTDTSGNVFVQDVPTPVSYNIVIDNAATVVTDSGNDIIAVTGTDANYAVALQFSNVDLGAGGSDTLSHTPEAIALSTADSQQSLAAGSSFTLSGSKSITLSSGNCANALYLCTVLTVPGTASYADIAATNNIKCISISTKKSCKPGMYICII